jgi:hypothetical protein
MAKKTHFIYRDGNVNFDFDEPPVRLALVEFGPLVCGSFKKL